MNLVPTSIEKPAFFRFEDVTNKTLNFVLLNNRRPDQWGNNHTKRKWILGEKLSASQDFCMFITPQL